MKANDENTKGKKVVVEVAAYFTHEGRIPTRGEMEHLMDKAIGPLRGGFGYASNDEDAGWLLNYVGSSFLPTTVDEVNNRAEKLAEAAKRFSVDKTN